jgi:hypothetical protein
MIEMVMYTDGLEKRGLQIDLAVIPLLPVDINNILSQ